MRSNSAQFFSVCVCVNWWKKASKTKEKTNDRQLVNEIAADVDGGNNRLNFKMYRKKEK